jgi:chromate transporter
LTETDGRHEVGQRGRVGELARLFLKLGIVAFGGPAAHIAMLEDEVVRRRQWIDRQHFLDLIGATNLIPGPNSTEMTMHVGYERAGWRGLLVAGSCFILPAVLITGGLAWLYVTYLTVPAIEPFLVGIKPAVIAVILGAVRRLAKPAIKDWRFALLGLSVVASLPLGLGEIPALLGGGVVGMLWFRLGGPGSGSALVAIALPALQSGPATAATVVAGAASGLASISLGKMFLFFLKLGAVLYGSGYVLVAFLEGGLVEGLGWLTQSQLLDAIAIGQLTPGPVLSTATFVGYVVHGWPGAVAATLGIFLPSFLFVIALNPLIPRVRRSAWMSSFLDAVNVSALALMVAVTLQLGADVLTSWQAWVVALLAGVLALGTRVNAAWLVAGGAVAGWLLR